jgi:hypothetical protein
VGVGDRNGVGVLVLVGRGVSGVAVFVFVGWVAGGLVCPGGDVGAGVVPFVGAMVGGRLGVALGAAVTRNVAVDVGSAVAPGADGVAPGADGVAPGVPVGRAAIGDAIGDAVGVGLLHASTIDVSTAKPSNDLRISSPLITAS